MARDYEALYRAKAAASTSTIQNETVSLPPGYLVGGDVRLRKDYTVLIKALAANVGGKLVKTASDHQLVEADWAVPRINLDRHYYIYIAKDGHFWVDSIAPVWNNQYLYWEQPNLKWRALGKMFLADDNIIFAIKEVEKNEQTVTVAPSGFTGKADYYCTGNNDQILINAAIRYLHEAFDGGSSQMLRGIYSTTEAITVAYENILLEGEGDGTIIEASTPDYAINIIANNVTVRNLCINPLSGTYTIYGSSVNKVTLLNLSINSARQSAIYLDGPSNLIVRECRINRFGIDAGSYGIGVFSSGTDAGIISGCHITCANSVGYQVVGISAENCIVTGNNIYNLVTTDVGTGIVVGGTNCIINNNIINTITSTDSDGIYAGSGITNAIINGNNVKNITGTNTNHGIWINGADYSSIHSNVVADNNDYGIYIGSGSIYCSLSGNYCYNNGSDAGIANTNSNNFYDAGTDTQVYSNSWQQPTAGEPSYGTFHWVTPASVLSTNTMSASVSYTIGSVTLGIPNYAKAILLGVDVQAGSYQLGFGPSSGYTPLRDLTGGTSWLRTQCIAPLTSGELRVANYNTIDTGQIAVRKQGYWV